jgi:hypothetical protein
MEGELQLLLAERDLILHGLVHCDRDLQVELTLHVEHLEWLQYLDW